MAADFDKPLNTDPYEGILEQLRDNIQAAQTLLNDLTGVTNIPTGAIRYDQALNKFESYDGSTFNDLVLSPAGGGTGITNWAKASTAEAEAGTADKYPDAAGVLASINENGFSGVNLVSIWSGSSTSLNLNGLAGGYPGNGLYVVNIDGEYTSIYFVNGQKSRQLYMSLPGGTLSVKWILKTSDEYLQARTHEYDGSFATTSSDSIIELFKVV